MIDHIAREIPTTNYIVLLILLYKITMEQPLQFGKNCATSDELFHLFRPCDVNFTTFYYIFTTFKSNTFFVAESDIFIASVKCQYGTAVIEIATPVLTKCIPGFTCHAII